MRQIRSWLVIAGCEVIALGCKGQSGEKAETAPATEKQEGDIPVVIGDCAPPTTPFVSGPEPQAFTPEDLSRPVTSPYATMSDGGDVSAGFGSPFESLFGSDGGAAGIMGAGDGFGVGKGELDRRAATITIGNIGARPSRGGKQGAPTVTMGKPDEIQLTGELDKTIVRRSLLRAMPRFQYCYEKQLLANPKLAGTVKITFTIDGVGTVASATPSGMTGEPGPCIATAITSMQFPKPKHATAVAVVPFTLAPGAYANHPPTQPPQPPAQATSHPSDKSVFAQLAPQGPSRPLSSHYVPGSSSPLVELRIALLDCFREQDKLYAAGVVDLANGSITPYGLPTGPAFTKCLANVATQVKVSTPIRCAIAFGRASVSDMPAVDVAADAITIAGKKLPLPSTDEMSKLDPWWNLAAVHDASKAHIDAVLAAKAPSAAIGPIIVRPVDATPMAIVTRLVLTLVDAGEDPILATQRSGVWQLLRAHHLPVVPVPLGTGGSWSSNLDIVRQADGSDAPPRLSMLVGAKDVWLGDSHDPKSGTRTPLPMLGDALTKLKAKFADREDIEIAGADDVPYKDVVAAIDAASATGFTAWTLTSPKGLSAHPQ